MMTTKTFSAALVALALTGCTQTASTPAAPPSGVVPAVTPNTFRMPTGAGCAGEIAQFRAVMKNDVETGNVGQGVYTRAMSDTDRADGACSAGRDGEARASLAATRSRYGYR